MLRLLSDRAGSVAAYAALFSVVAVGGGALAVDFGRSVLLRSQMQNAADAAALASVVHLDGKDGARARAAAVATNAVSNRSSMPAGEDDTALEVASVDFYATLAPAPVAATTDLEAKAVEVTLKPQTVSYILAPVLKQMTGSGNTEIQLAARAVATTRPYLCHAPPLMMCDLAEADPADDPTVPANAGRQVRLKEPQAGGGSWAPGNFGLLALPDGSSGASAIDDALAAVEPADCYQLDVITATGSKTNKVKNGINTRFDISTMSYPPAPNVINYPRDDALIADPGARIGNAVWDIDGHWLAKHGASVPAGLSGASRYQAYLYELGETFARDGKRTVHPVPPGGPPAGFAVVTPPAADVPADAAHPTLPDYDGVPQNTPAANGPARRLVRVALLQCVAEGVNGHGTYPTHGRFVEMFVTEEVRDPPEAAIYAEIVRSLSTISDPEFHANAQLVE